MVRATLSRNRPTLAATARLALVTLLVPLSCERPAGEVAPVQRLALPPDTWRPPSGLWMPTLGGGLAVFQGFEEPTDLRGMDKPGGARQARFPGAPDGVHVLELDAGCRIQLIWPGLAQQEGREDREAPPPRRPWRVTVMTNLETPGQAFLIRFPKTNHSPPDAWIEGVERLAELKPEGKAGSWLRLGATFRTQARPEALGLLLSAPSGAPARFDAACLAATDKLSLDTVPGRPSWRRVTLSHRDNRWSIPLWSHDQAEFQARVGRDAPRLTLALAYVTRRLDETTSPASSRPVLPPAQVGVVVGAQGRETELEVLEIPAARSLQEATWIESTIALDRWAEEPVSIRFECRVAGGHPDPYGVVFLGAPRLLTRPPAAQRSSAGLPDRRPNVVMISIDTLRADRLGTYGYERPISPRIDALARRGVLVEKAYTTSAYTLPGHASLFTGQYPSTHGAMDGETPITPSISPHLAEILAHAGYITLASTAGGFLDPFFGFPRGFDIYGIQDPHDPLAPTRPGECIPPGLQRALDRLDETEGLPFFLFLHTYAVHDFHPLEEDLRPFCRGPVRSRQHYRNLHRRLLLDQKNDYRDATPEDAAELSDLYDGTIHGVDRVIGGLVDYLEAHRLLDRTIIILTSDHGEEFLEHGGLFHGRTLYEEIIHVPMIWVGPNLPAGRRVSGPMSLADVAPTLLGLLGIDDPQAKDRMQGKDLQEHLRGSGTADPGVFAEIDWKRFASTVYREGDFKAMRWLLSSGTHQSWESSLFDLLQDPGETHDLSPHFPRRACRLSAAMKIRLKKLRQARDSWRKTGGSASGAMPETLRARLGGIGYLSEGDLRGPEDPLDKLELAYRDERPLRAFPDHGIATTAAPDAKRIQAALAGSSVADQMRAARQISELGPDGARWTPQLAKALESPEARVREEVLYALGRIGRIEASLSARVAALASDSSPRVRLAAVFALGHVAPSPEAGLNALQKALHDSRSWIRRQAAAGLAEFGPAAAPALGDLISILDSPRDALVIARAVAGMGQVALPALLEALRNDSSPSTPEPTGDGSLSWMIIETLRLMGRQAVDDLIAALASPHPRVSQGSHLALERIGRAAVPRMVESLRRPDAGLREAAAEILCGMGRQAAPAAPALLEALGDEEAGVRRWSAAAIGAIGEGGAAVLTRLVAALEDPEPSVRAAAAGALAHQNTETRDAIPAAAISALIDLLSDPDPEVCIQAAMALGTLGEGNVEAARALGQALHSSATGLRRTAAIRLKLMGPAALPALTELVAALADEDRVVVCTVADALGMIGPAASPAIPALRELLEHPARQVRRAARQALQKIKP